MMQQNNPTFAFLDFAHQYHPYYELQLRLCEQRAAKEKLADNAATTELQLPRSQISTTSSDSLMAPSALDASASSVSSVKEAKKLIASLSSAPTTPTPSMTPAQTSQPAIFAAAQTTTPTPLFAIAAATTMPTQSTGLFAAANTDSADERNAENGVDRKRKRECHNGDGSGGDEVGRVVQRQKF
jgi:hypothetical protein